MCFGEVRERKYAKVFHNDVDGFFCLVKVYDVDNRGMLDAFHNLYLL